MNDRLLITLTFMLMAIQAQAATFVVDDWVDREDGSVGDGVCLDDVGTHCTLRAAIMEAEALGGDHTVVLMSLPAPFVHQLSLVGDDIAGEVGDLNINSANLTITGHGPEVSIIDASEINDRILRVANNGSITLSNLTLQFGQTDANGGAIEATGNNAVINLDNVVFKNNDAFSGGGLAITATNAEVNLSQVAFSDNSALFGGGMYVANGVSTPVNISQTLFDNNSGGGFPDSGAAIECSNCALVIDQSTFTNQYQASDALFLTFSNLTMTNSTIADNNTGGVGTWNANATIRFSTLANNAGYNLSHVNQAGGFEMSIGRSVLFMPAAASGDDCAANDLPVSAGHNIVSDASCVFTAAGDLENTDALLAPLADNGGSTPTMLPMMNSSVLNHVPLANCLDAMNQHLLMDQRGLPRPLGSGCEAGAVEADPDLIFASGFD